MSYQKIIFLIIINLIIHISCESSLYQKFLDEQEDFFNNALDIDRSDNNNNAIGSFENNLYRRDLSNEIVDEIEPDDSDDAKIHSILNRISSYRDAQQPIQQTPQALINISNGELILSILFILPIAKTSS